VGRGINMIFKNWFYRNEEVKETTSVQLWSVRWTARKGEFAADTYQAAEFFTDEESAESFKHALLDAFKLTKDSSGIKSIRSQKED